MYREREILHTYISQPLVGGHALPGEALPRRQHALRPQLRGGAGEVQPAIAALHRECIYTYTCIHSYMYTFIHSYTY